MRAVARLFALGRAGLPDVSSAAACTCSGFAFLPCGLPSAGFGAFCFFSSAISLLHLSHGFGTDFSPVREAVNFGPSTRSPRRPRSLLQRRSAMLAGPHVMVAVLFVLHPRRALARRAHQHHVAEVNR